MTQYDRRRLYSCCFHIDANRINASGRLANMNQLEAWHKTKVIRINMAETAQSEAARGSSVRTRKAYHYIATKTMNLNPEEADLKRRIQLALFPQGFTSESDQNDVDIVFNAKKYGCALVTNDGGSRTQPGGILGNRHKLLALGIRVLTDEEAVAEVRNLITRRDETERERHRIRGEPLPDWVGRD